MDGWMDGGRQNEERWRGRGGMKRLMKRRKEEKTCPHRKERSGGRLRDDLEEDEESEKLKIFPVTFTSSQSAGEMKTAVAACTMTSSLAPGARQHLAHELGVGAADDTRGRSSSCSSGQSAATNSSLLPPPEITFTPAVICLSVQDPAAEPAHVMARPEKSTRGRGRFERRRGRRRGSRR
eukprot:765315-Hanusia_phi.AAC.1